MSLIMLRWDSGYMYCPYLDAQMGPNSHKTYMPTRMSLWDICQSKSSILAPAGGRKNLENGFWGITLPMDEGLLFLLAFILLPLIHATANSLNPTFITGGAAGAILSSTAKTKECVLTIVMI